MIEVETTPGLRLYRHTYGGKAAALVLLMAICSLTAPAQKPTPSPSPQDLQVLDAAAPNGGTAGPRYAEKMMATVDR